MNIRRMLLLLVVMVSMSPTLNAATGLSEADVAKIMQVHKNYEASWLRGDANGVRSLFTADCVLLPPHADKPRIGHRGLDEYWFPPNSPPTKITKLVVTPESIDGDGQIAYVWGTDEVAWTTVQEGKTVTASHKGMFLNILRKQPDGEWKMSHHMWDDPVAPH